MQLWLQRSCRSGLHRSSGLQKAQAIRMTTDGSATLVRLPKQVPLMRRLPLAFFILPLSVARQDKHRSVFVTLRAGKSIVKTLCCALLILSLSVVPESRAQSVKELTVGAAADLSPALKDLGDSFERKTGIHLKFSFGASGALTQQIENGAPFDLFFSADMDYPRQLVRDGQADASTLYQYAVGKLVLWVAADSSLDVEHKGMNALLDPSVKKISIANPQHAPYGRAAVEALKHAGIYDRLADKIVMGENVSQAAQFAESGNAQAGFVALAHAVSLGMQGKGKYWEIPGDYYAPLAQGAVVISRSPHKKQAAQFLEYVKTKPAAETFQRYGFTLP